MDETTHDMVIQRLELGVDGMVTRTIRSEPESYLRLADLYADRARLKGHERNGRRLPGLRKAPIEEIAAKRSPYIRRHCPILKKRIKGVSFCRLHIFII